MGKKKKMKKLAKLLRKAELEAAKLGAVNYVNTTAVKPGVVATISSKLAPKTVQSAKSPAKKKTAKKTVDKLINEANHEAMAHARVDVEKAREAEKAAATEAKEPWFDVWIELDPEDPNKTSGAFVLDWNETFVARLLKRGYNGKTEQDVVEQWFNQRMHDSLAGHYEDEMADPEKRRTTQRKRLSKELTEVG